MGQVAGIYGRRSIRKYLNEELQVGILEEIKEASKSVKRLYEDIDMDIHIVEDGTRFQKIIRGILGRWGKIRAPHYIVVTSDKSEGYLENAGFALESIVLSLANVGIGTCFIGRGINQQLLKTIVPVKNSHDAFIVLSFGYPKSEENSRKRMLRWRKRMEIDEFTSGYITKTWQHILETVRMAPSAMNTKPWKFFINDNIVDIYSIDRHSFFFRNSSEKNRLALGAALYHIYIAAKGLEKDVQIKSLPARERNGYRYITSVIEDM